MLVIGASKIIEKIGLRLFKKAQGLFKNLRTKKNKNHCLKKVQNQGFKNRRNSATSMLLVSLNSTQVYSYEKIILILSLTGHGCIKNH
jgi:hypothetical protein